MQCKVCNKIYKSTTRCVKHENTCHRVTTTSSNNPFQEDVTVTHLNNGEILYPFNEEDCIMEYELQTIVKRESHDVVSICANGKLGKVLNEKALSCGCENLSQREGRILLSSPNGYFTQQALSLVNRLTIYFEGVLSRDGVKLLVFCILY